MIAAKCMISAEGVVGETVLGGWAGVTAPRIAP
jgi:hypothetical protein